MKRGFFSVWIVVSILGVGLVGFSWSGIFAGAWREGCFHDDGVSRAPMTPKRRLKRGVFRSIFELQATINRFLEEHNQKSQPFKWTADPDKIIAAVRGGTKC